MKQTYFDGASLGKEFDLFAIELSKLPKSTETTSLELRFALLRQAVELTLANSCRLSTQLPASLFSAN
jgi:hypothetical protein